MGPPAGRDAPGTLTVRVARVGKVAGPGRSAYPNLLAGSEGGVLRVQVPAAAAATLEVDVGARIALDVRRGRSAAQVFARPDRITIRPA